MFVKNHKKINKQKRLFKIKIWTVKWTKGNQTEIFRWKKDNLQIYSLLKKCFKTIIISPIKYKLFY